MHMKHKVTVLAKAYLLALKEHQREGSHLSLQPALGIGCEACVLGMEPLQLQRLHKRATAKLNLPPSHGISFKRAQRFLKDALIPLLKMDSRGPLGESRLNRLHRNFERGTAQLSAARLKLRAGVESREVLESKLSRDEHLFAALLQESLRLQGDLRKLTHQAFTAQERERRMVSRELRDNIAQNLLGINVRLINLKHEVRTNAKGLKSKIAHAQRLVMSSAKSVNQAALKHSHI